MKLIVGPNLAAFSESILSAEQRGIPVIVLNDVEFKRMTTAVHALGISDVYGAFLVNHDGSIAINLAAPLSQDFVLKIQDIDSASIAPQVLKLQLEPPPPLWRRHDRLDRRFR